MNINSRISTLQHSTPFNILYIENDNTIHKIIYPILQEFCTSLILAKNAIDGLEQFQSNHIDLIITDLEMPDLNGMNMIQKIREITTNIPIIITSAYQDMKTLHESIHYGVEGYVLKPIVPEQLIKTISTIKKRLKKEYLLKQYQKITDESSIISKSDKNGVITYVNDAFCELSGYTRAELIGKEHNIVRSKEESKELFEKLWERILKKKKRWAGVIKNQNKSGHIYYIKATITPILDHKGEIKEFIALAIPITNIIHPQEQLDAFLTPLKSPLIVLIKIEEFKYLNHELSKKLQNIFAKELFKAMPSKCNFSKIYLLDNGEFIFVKKSHSHLEKKKLYHEVQIFQKEINNKKIKVGLIDYHLSILISIASGKNALNDTKAGIRQLLKSKQNFIIADQLQEQEKKSAIKKLKTFKMLKDAIESYNIISYFQPIVNNKTRTIEKYESLVRLIDTNKNIIAPYFFLETAKEGKYYQKITSIVLKNSFNALYKTTMNISINLSALDIEQKETREEFLFLLEQHKEETHRVVIELLEDESIHNIQLTKDFMKKVREFGVKVAIDDFGTGLSNFSRVLHYKPDFIKIDGSLIKNIEHDDFSRSMVETIVIFAQKQNIKTIAEYVENESIFDIICEIGVDYSQGYYFGKAEVLSSLKVE